MILSSVGGPACQAEKESLDRNDINGIDSVNAIHISRRQPASGQKGDVKEMPLDGNHIDGGNPAGAWRPGGLGRRYGISRARGQR